LFCWLCGTAEAVPFQNGKLQDNHVHVIALDRRSSPLPCECGLEYTETVPGRMTEIPLEVDSGA
jgi:hypothetical protein